VVVERGADEVAQRLVGEGDAAEMRRQLLDVRHRQVATLEFVADAFDAAQGGGTVHAVAPETVRVGSRFKNG